MNTTLAITISQRLGKDKLFVEEMVEKKIFKDSKITERDNISFLDSSPAREWIRQCKLVKNGYVGIEPTTTWIPESLAKEGNIKIIEVNQLPPLVIDGGHNAGEVLDNRF